MTLLTTSILTQKILHQLLSLQKQKFSRRSKFSLGICVRECGGMRMWPLNIHGDMMAIHFFTSDSLIAVALQYAILACC